MKISRFSAYTLDSSPSSGKELLNVKNYSLFKYGHKPVVYAFAKKMLAEFLEKYSFDWIKERRDQIVVTTSPFWHTPPSANSLATVVHHLLNEYLFDRGIEALRFVRINRSAAPSTDFSKLNAKERIANMKKDGLSVDVQSVKKRRVILVEDARITGAHEQKTIEYLEKSGVHEVVFLYVIDVKDGKKDPDVENRMNHSVINSLEELYVLMRHPEGYILNSRACRFVLSWSDKKELASFCQKLPMELLSEIYMASINDGYGLIEKYKEGFEVLRAEYKVRSAKKPVSVLKSVINHIFLSSVRMFF